MRWPPASARRVSSSRAAPAVPLPSPPWLLPVSLGGPSPPAFLCCPFSSHLRALAGAVSHLLLAHARAQQLGGVCHTACAQLGGRRLWQFAAAGAGCAPPLSAGGGVVPSPGGGLRQKPWRRAGGERWLLWVAVSAGRHGGGHHRICGAGGPQRLRLRRRLQRHADAAHRRRRLHRRCALSPRRPLSCMLCNLSPAPCDLSSSLPPRMPGRPVWGPAPAAPRGVRGTAVRAEASRAALGPRQV